MSEEEVEYEALPHSAPFHIQLLAGSMAGVAEHSIMYPFDVVKTRLQTGATTVKTTPPVIEHHCSAHRTAPLLPKTEIKQGIKVTSESLVSIIARIWRTEGPSAITRGLSAAVIGSVPAHAIYFTTYERVKTVFQNNFLSSNSVFAATFSQAFAGCCATMAHDAIMNPAEVIKQRMQLCSKDPASGKGSCAATIQGKPIGGCSKQSFSVAGQQIRLINNSAQTATSATSPAMTSYSGCIDCAVKTVRKEGFIAFYRSYPTQLTMNVPFQAAHFVIYEAALKYLNPSKEYNPLAHSLAGAAGGAFAAALTNPLDVCKTLLNTQWCVRLHPELVKQNHIAPGAAVPTFGAAARAVYACFGISGFFRGTTARMVIQAPSTAVAWTVYEFFKYHMKNATNEET